MRGGVVLKGSLSGREVRVRVRVDPMTGCLMATPWIMTKYFTGSVCIYTCTTNKKTVPYLAVGVNIPSPSLLTGARQDSRDLPAFSQ